MGRIEENGVVGSGLSYLGLRATMRAWVCALIRLGADCWLDALFGFALFVALFGMPLDAVGPHADHSWQQALQECFKIRAQAGSDYIFTYGPLGALTNLVYDETNYWPAYAWQLIFNATIAAIMVLFARRIPAKDARFLFYASLLLYGAPPFDLRFVIPAVALAILLVISAPRGPALVFAGLFLAGLCLIKFTLALFALLAILLVTTWKWWETGRRTVFVLPEAFAAGVIGFWLATGQALANLPKFVSLSLEMADGYVEAMSVAGPRTSLVLALAILSLDMLVCLAVILHARHKGRFLVCLTLTFAALHLQFRHGFIRQDLHCLVFFGFAMTFPFFIAVAEPSAIRRWPVRLGFGLTLILAAQGFQEADGIRAPDLPERALALCETLSAQFHKITDPLAVEDELRQKQQQYRENSQLPKITALVGGASIDMVSNLQAMLFLNGLHWTPRPVFQSYAAFTPKLLDLNQEFYRGSRAPRFVLFQLGRIDGRFPAAEDGGVLLELLRNYRPVAKENGYFLLQHREGAERSPLPAPQRTIERMICLDEVVPLPSMSGEYMTASFHFQLQTSGKLLHVLYRNPLLSVHVRTSDGSCRQYRLVPGTAAHEFLLNPLTEDNEDFVGLYCGKCTKQIVSLSVTQEEFFGWQPYQTDIHLTLKTYPLTLVPQISAAESALLRSN